MSTVPSRARRAVLRLIAGAGALALAACEPISTGGPSINPNAPVPVALLVPSGSGNGADDALAASLENAARLAMADLQGAEIDLRVYPTAGSAAGASAAATKAIDDGARIILGPVYAEEAAAAGVAAASRGVNVLAFSNNPDIAGRNVFILGSTFQNTANRLARYAVAQGRNRVVIVNGQDAAEEIGRDAIQRAVASAGGSVAGVVPFQLSQQGVIDAMPSIAGQIRGSGANAVFFTSGTNGAIPFLTQLLPENGISPETVKFIGLQRWDIPQSALSLPGLQGGWFAMPDPAVGAQFQARYAASYGAAPHPIAGLAYDGIAAIGALARTGRPNALTAQSLTQPTGFAGVNGVFRLLSNGTNERALAIAEVRNGQAVVIDPAPRAFAGAGL